MVEVACCRCLLHKLFDLIASDEPILKGAFDAADDARCVVVFSELDDDIGILGQPGVSIRELLLATAKSFISPRRAMVSPPQSAQRQAGALIDTGV
jgi:hypothetical protein